MGMTAGSPRARALGSAMRQAREKAKIQDSTLSIREVANRTGTDYSAISRWENGLRVPALEDVEKYLSVMKVPVEEQEKILKIRREGEDSNWLTAGIPGVSQGLLGVLECERTARRIIDFGPLLIPGLLQTSDYARNIIRSEPALLLRAGRRDILSRANPTELVALIGESAIRTPLGGWETYVGQLKYLKKITDELPNVTIRVVPTHVTKWHPGLSGSFIFYEFPDSPPIIYLEHHRSSAFVYDDDDVAEYRRTVKVLEEEVAMSASASLEFIARLIREAGETV